MEPLVTKRALLSLALCLCLFPPLCLRADRRQGGLGGAGRHAVGRVARRGEVAARQRHRRQAEAQGVPRAASSAASARWWRRPRTATSSIFGGSTGAVAAYVPELNVLELPYIFTSDAEADYVLDKTARSRRQAARDQGLRDGDVGRERLARLRREGEVPREGRRHEGPQDAQPGVVRAPRDLQGLRRVTGRDVGARGAGRAADRHRRRLLEHAALLVRHQLVQRHHALHVHASTSTSRASWCVSKKWFDSSPTTSRRR